MKFLFKLLLLTTFVGGGTYYTVRNVPAVRERAIEIVNPSAKAKRLTLELESDIAALSQTLENSVGTDNVESAKKILESVKGKLTEITELQEKDPGYIRAELGNILEKIGDNIDKDNNEEQGEPDEVTPITTELPQIGEVLCVPVEKD